MDRQTIIMSHSIPFPESFPFVHSHHTYQWSGGVFIPRRGEYSDNGTVASLLHTAHTFSLFSHSHSPLYSPAHLTVCCPTHTLFTTFHTLHLHHTPHYTHSALSHCTALGSALSCTLHYTCTLTAAPPGFYTALEDPTIYWDGMIRVVVFIH